MLTSPGVARQPDRRSAVPLRTRRVPGRPDRGDPVARDDDVPACDLAPGRIDRRDRAAVDDQITWQRARPWRGMADGHISLCCPDTMSWWYGTGRWPSSVRTIWVSKV